MEQQGVSTWHVPFHFSLNATSSPKEVILGLGDLFSSLFPSYTHSFILQVFTEHMQYTGIVLEAGDESGSDILLRKTNNKQLLNINGSKWYE